jgi:hypothetical protein
MHPFEELLYRRIQEYVAVWSPEERADTYIAALTFWDEFSGIINGEREWTAFGWETRGTQVYCQDVFGFSHNTRANLREQIPRKEAEPDEYEWMMQRWKGSGAQTPALAEELPLYHDWCTSHQVPQYEWQGRLGTDEAGNPIYDYETLAQVSVAAGERIVRRLHENAVVSVPVLISVFTTALNSKPPATLIRPNS